MLNYITLESYIINDDIDSLSCFLSKDEYPNEGMSFFRTSITEGSYKCAHYILELYELDIFAKDICNTKDFEYRVNNILRNNKIEKLLKNVQQKNT